MHALLLCTVLSGLDAEPLARQEALHEYQSISLEIFGSQDSDRDIRLFTDGVSWGRELFRILSGHIEPKIVFTSGNRVPEDEPTPPQEADGLGVGASGLLRWSPIRIWVLEPHVEASTGMVFTTEEFPPSGTIWNFWSRWGAGISIWLSDDVALLVAVRRLHLSNWKGFGHPRNPSYDGDGLTIALQR